MIINENVLKSGERVAFGLRDLYSAYGYSQYKMSKFEEYDLYAGNKDFLISDNVITFTDTNGKLMALKPDVTLSIVKHAKDSAGLHKVYYDENVYRISGSSRSYREIMQVGLECIGAINDCAVAEVLMLAAQSLARISPDYVLDISQLDVVSAVINTLDVDAATRAELLVAVGEKNLHTIRRLCENGEDLCRLVALQGAPAKVLPTLREMLSDPAALDAVDRLSRTVDALDACGYGERVRIDFSVVDDMNYYNGIAFKGFVNGVPEAVLSGGQYDRLMRKMGKKAGAIGFAVYLDLLERLEESTQGLDADVLVQYEADVAPECVLKTVNDLVGAGERVIARPVGDCGELRCGRQITLTAKGEC